MAMKPLPKLIIIAVVVGGIGVAANKFLNTTPSIVVPPAPTVEQSAPPPVHPALVEREQPGVVTAAHPAVITPPVPQPASPDPSKDRGLANLLQSR